MLHDVQEQLGNTDALWAYAQHVARCPRGLPQQASAAVQTTPQPPARLKPAACQAGETPHTQDQVIVT